MKKVLLIALRTLLLHLALLATTLPVYLILSLILPEYVETIGEVGGDSGPVHHIISSLILLVAVCLTVYIFWVEMDHRHLKDIGLRWSFKDAGFGMGLGIVLISLLTSFLLLFGQIGIESGDGNWFNFLLLSCSFLLVGFNEELLYRGYLLPYYKQRMPLWLAVVLSSLVFGLVHLGNRNVSIAGIVGVILAGFLLALLRLNNKSLWGAIGFHFTWNLFQGPFYGFAVSGTSDFYSIFKVIPLGDDWLTGGKFGLEGSWLTNFVIVVWCLIFAFQVKKKRKDGLMTA